MTRTPRQPRPVVRVRVPLATHCRFDSLAELSDLLEFSDSESQSRVQCPDPSLRRRRRPRAASATKVYSPSFRSLHLDKASHPGCGPAGDVTSPGPSASTWPRAGPPRIPAGDRSVSESPPGHPCHPLPPSHERGSREIATRPTCPPTPSAAPAAPAPALVQPGPVPAPAGGGGVAQSAHPPREHPHLPRPPPPPDPRPRHVCVCAVSCVPPRHVTRGGDRGPAAGPRRARGRRWREGRTLQPAPALSATICRSPHCGPPSQRFTCRGHAYAPPVSTPCLRAAR